MAAVLALSAIAGWAGDSRASGPSWLEWSAPPGCPQSTDIERRVNEWVGGSLPEDGDLSVRTTLSRSAKQWDVGVVISREGQTAERRVSVSSCAAAADFVAIAVALAVDPGLAARLESDTPAVFPAATEDSQRESSAAPSPAEDPAAPPPSADAGSSNEAGSTNAVAPAGSPPPGAPRGSARTDETSRGAEPPDTRASQSFQGEARRSPWQVHASLWGEDAWRTLPRPAAGVGLGAGADHGRWSVAFGLRRLLPVTETPDRAVAPIEFSLLGVRGTVGYRLLGPRVQVGPLVSVEGGAVLAHQQGSTADSVTEPWCMLGLGAGTFVALSGRTSFTSELELSIPLTRPTFVLSDRSEVYQVGAGGRGLLGVRFLFDSE